MRRMVAPLCQPPTPPVRTAIFRRANWYTLLFLAVGPALPRAPGGCLAETGGEKDEKPWSPPTSFEEYRLLWPLGRGGMGEVYLGHDTVLDRPVAIKFVMNLEADEQVRERYLIEARAAARLQHPNVVTIYRVGEIDAHPYIIAEYIQGQDLQALPKPVPWQFALELAIGLSRGLAAAHKRGVLHRDVKPANAILADNGEVKLLDFGLAKYIDKPDAVSVRWANQEVVAPTMEATASGHFSPLSADATPPFDGPVKISVQGQAALSAAQLVPLPAAFPAVAQSDDQIRPVELRKTDPPKTPLGYSRSSQIKGTPIYMAPERLLGAPATRRSDVYSMGALFYELPSGVPPHFDVPFEKLPQVVPERDAPPLPHLAPSVDPQLSQVVDRCLKRNPADRYASGEDLQAALEQCVKGKHAAMLPEGNPYRGVLAYDSDHRSLFFGRRADCGTLLDRLRSEPVMLVAGDGGSGKTSLVRAGLIPLIGEGAIGGGRRWRTISTQPGRHPLQSLSEALAETIGPRSEQSDLRAMMETDPQALQKLLQKRTSERRGIALFIDQLEDLLHHGSPAEAKLYLQTLATLFEPHPGLRLVLAAQSQSIGPLSSLSPDLLDWTRDVYFLKPLPRDRLREVIVEPAQSKGIRFEPATFVDELLDFAQQSDGGLSLLGIVLAELWDSRHDNAMGLQALSAIGGLAGAIARHADHVIGSLSRDRRIVARRLLLLLVTPEKALCRRSEDELSSHSPDAQRVLHVLLSGRLVCMTETPSGGSYQLAHPLLATSWPTMQRWIDEQAPVQPSRPSLPAIRIATEPPVYKHFRRIGWSLLPTALLVLGLSGSAYYEQIQFKRKNLTLLASAQHAIAEGQSRQALVTQYQKLALEMLDGPRRDKVQEQWELARSAAAQAERAYSRASQALEQSLRGSENQRAVRDDLARLLYDRALIAEWAHEEQLLDELIKRIQLYDDKGTWMVRWQRPGRLSLSSQPTGAKVTVQRYVIDAQGKWFVTENTELGTTPLRGHVLSPGSYLITVSLAGQRDIRLPTVVGHDEEIKQHVTLP